MVTNKRVVMCRGTWPEDGYADFAVFAVLPNESDSEAALRAEKAYSPNEVFYIREVGDADD